MCRPSAPDVFGTAVGAERLELVANPAGDVEHCLERHAVGRVEIERDVIGVAEATATRENHGILRDGRELRGVEQRLQRRRR